MITPRAQNPTGATLTPLRAEALSATLAGFDDVMVVHDDHAGPIAGADFVTVRPPGLRWATIRSLGKSLGPDMRLALVAGDPTTVDRISISRNHGPGWSVICFSEPRQRCLLTLR